jgi:thiosulfate dehydrogenase
MKKGITICVLLAIAVTAVIIAVIPDTKKVNAAALTVIDDRYLWEAPDTIHIPHTKEGDLIRYGRQLVAQTAYYLGPKGVVAAISNGMNCQNCHLDAGPFHLSILYSGPGAVPWNLLKKGSTTVYNAV